MHLRHYLHGSLEQNRLTARAERVTAMLEGRFGARFEQMGAAAPRSFLRAFAFAALGVGPRMGFGLTYGLEDASAAACGVLAVETARDRPVEITALADPWRILGAAPAPELTIARPLPRLETLIARVLPSETLALSERLGAHCAGIMLILAPAGINDWIAETPARAWDEGDGGRILVYEVEPGRSSAGEAFVWELA